MLKIKDNVDLKELEKFGLKPHYKINANTGEKYIDCFISSKYMSRWGFMRLTPKKKHLFLWIPSKIFENNLNASPLFVENGDYLDIDLIFDLIKSDLVEKVEEHK